MTQTDDAGRNESQRGLSRATRTRLLALVVLLPCMALLATAASLIPDVRGYGTHEQLGLGRCGLLITSGLPCPTCGMTTAFAYTVRGRLIEAFWAQPSGLLLALATSGLTAGALWTLIAGARPALPLPQLTPYRLFWGLLILFVGGWAFKLVVGLSTGALPEHP